MAVRFLNFTDNSINLEKFRKNPKNSNLKSFWAFILSIFLYISIFYVFKLSPSSILFTTKFWFFISNTLILIIAADFGSFSSKEHDLYEEYVKNTITRPKTVPSFELQYVKFPQHTVLEDNNRKNEVDDDHEKPQEKIICVDDGEHVHEPEENRGLVPREEGNDVNIDEQAAEEDEKLSQEDIKEIDNGALEPKEVKWRTLEAKCSRSNSDKAILTADNEAKAVVLHRTMSEGREFDHQEAKEEEDEFSCMSNEELNRRVEEFIRKFNRQIRMQAVRSRHQLERGSI